VLYLFGFQRIGVVIGDLYFVDPDPEHGQDSPERGVRLEVRMLEQGELKGNFYSSRPIGIERPVWRADLLESVDGPPGSLNRAHHHPAFEGWNPGRRKFDPELSASPVSWVGEALGDLEGLLERAGLAPDDALAADAVSLRESVPQIMATVAGLLEKVKAGELALAPAGQVSAARISWL
jgi:hypothetical protein